MNSSRKQGSKILGVIARSEAEQLLLDWANLANIDDPGPYLRLLRKHSDAFQELMPVDSQDLILFRGLLRLGWETPSAYRRQWYLFELRMMIRLSVRRKGSGHTDDALLHGDVQQIREFLEPPQQP